MIRSALFAVLLLSAAIVSGAGSKLDNQALTEAASVLRSEPRNSGAWKVMQGVAEESVADEEIRSRVLYLYALSHLGQRNTNGYNSVIGKLVQEHPEQAPGVTNRLSHSDWLVECETCGGRGVRLVAVGKGVEQERQCHICRGSGRLLELGPRVREAFQGVLEEIGSRSADNLEFDSSVAKVLAITVLEQRIPELERVLERFAHRSDLAVLEQALSEAVAERLRIEEAATRRQKEREESHREDEEYRVLIQLLESVAFSRIPRALVAIDNFMERYPGSSYLADLHVQYEKQERRLKLYRKFWFGIYLCGGAMVLFLVFALLKDLVMRNQKVEVRRPLPTPKDVVAQGDDDQAEGSDTL